MDKAQPDIVCLNETKTDPEKIDKVTARELPEEYEQHWNCSKLKKGYSGVAIFTKIKPLKVMHDIEDHDGNANKEGRVLTMELEKFFLVACYTPNAGEDLRRVDYRTTQWDQDFFAHLRRLEKTKPVVLGGDLNVAHKDIDLYPEHPAHEDD